ncbi:unnamed protein product [Pleuronectes platessa]|uniref:Uncharacterized protein n=1 Tax=Pleuronectes platessa TaxID=8262 RepID=A0A9N7TSA2_PLEPL|nr:unnamed protein product [Pleuronectes platessa]
MQIEARCDMKSFQQVLGLALGSPPGWVCQRSRGSLTPSSLQMSELLTLSSVEASRPTEKAEIENKSSIQSSACVLMQSPTVLLWCAIKTFPLRDYPAHVVLASSLFPLPALVHPLNDSSKYRLGKQLVARCVSVPATRGAVVQALSIAVFKIDQVRPLCSAAVRIGFMMNYYFMETMMKRVCLYVIEDGK